MRTRWLLAASLGLAACAPVPGLAPIGDPAPPASEGPRYRVFAASELAVRAIAVDSTAPGFSSARLADGDFSTQWSNGGYLNPSSWVVLELEASAALSAIALKTPPSKPGSQYDVQVSEDGQRWTTALAAQTSTSWSLETKTLPAGTQGRFVRIFWRNGGSEPHFSVFEAVVHGQVSGAPAPSAPPSSSPSPSPSPSAPPPAPGGSAGATASSSYAGMTPDRAIDGDYSSQWASGGYQEREAWLTIDTGARRQLSNVTTKMRPQGGEGYFQIEISRDGQVFEPVTGRLKNTTWGPEPRALPAGTEGRFVRLRFFNDPARPDARFSVFETAITDGGATTSPSPSATPTTAPTAVPTVTPTLPPGTGAPTPLRRVSLPGQAVASTGSGSLAVDGDPASVWSTWGALPQWLAVPLDAPASGPLVVSWHAASYHFTDTGYSPRHYHLEASADSTDGRNGTWQTAATHRDNPLRSRADTINAPGARWVRLTIDTRWNVGPSLREVEVHSATSAQRLDSWLILGDSITAQSFDPARPNSFPDRVASLTGQRPLLIGGGTGSDTAALATPRLAAALPTLPPGSFVGLALGTNDATTGVPVATFKAQMQQMVTSIKQSGRTPMLARTSWSLNPNLPRYVQAIDELRAENGLPPGPDLYTHFKNHPEELRSDRVHPTATGERSIQRLWAEAVARAYGD